MFLLYIADFWTPTFIRANLVLSIYSIVNNLFFASSNGYRSVPSIFFRCLRFCQIPMLCDICCFVSYFPRLIVCYIVVCGWPTIFGAKFPSLNVTALFVYRVYCNACDGYHSVLYNNAYCLFVGASLQHYMQLYWVWHYTHWQINQLIKKHQVLNYRMHMHIRTSYSPNMTLTWESRIIAFKPCKRTNNSCQ